MEIYPTTTTIIVVIMIAVIVALMFAKLRKKYDKAMFIINIIFTISFVIYILLTPHNKYGYVLALFFVLVSLYNIYERIKRGKEIKQ